MSVLVVARWTVLEARRRRLVLAGVVLSVAFVALFAVGFALLYADQERSLSQAGALGGGLEAREELLAMSTILVLLGLYGVQFLAVLLGLFLGVASVSPEIDSGALHAVLARPL
ncbi:MAG TPA: ABC transporter permease, partial [Actinomycetota bacterium]|nr:ABC transporter permease [Actinomycetota bacterium]